MTTLRQLTDFCDHTLRINDFNDRWCVNGLQIAAADDTQVVSKVALMTTASHAALAAAAAWGAQVAIAHHGVLRKTMTGRIDRPTARRLATLLDHELSLLAYHLPLDGQPEWGNNAAIATALPLQKWQIAADYCVIGELTAPLPLNKLATQCGQLFGQAPLVGDFCDGAPVARIGICSGGGGGHAAELAALGIDTLLTGEIAEHNWHELKELGVNLLACGHHATERAGVQNLGTQISTQFPSITTQFFNEECPI